MATHNSRVSLLQWQWNSLELGGAGMCTIASLSSNYTKEKLYSSLS